jgi:hypothetical protein
MALPQYDMSALIQNIKRRCTVPTSQLTFTDDDFSLLANDELQGELVPLIMSTREEYFVDFYEVNAPSDGIIHFPGNTVGIKIRSVCYVQQTRPLLLINLPRIDLDVVAGLGWQNYTTIAGFYIQGNDLCIYPGNSVPQNTVIRIYYYKRSLVLASPLTYTQITAIDSNTNTVTVGRIPKGWTTGTQVNTISQSPNFKITNDLATVVTASFPTITLDSVEGMEVGDYICEYGYTAIPQIPVEAHAYLAQITAAKCLESLGDRDGMKAALDKAETLKTGLLTMMSQRVDGSVKKVMAPRGGMRLGAGLGRWGRGSSGGTF